MCVPPVLGGLIIDKVASNGDISALFLLFVFSRLLLQFLGNPHVAPRLCEHV